MTVMTVTGGPAQVAEVLGKITGRFHLTPRKATEVPTPDTLAYQYEQQGLSSMDAKYRVEIGDDDTFRVVQGKAESSRTITKFGSHVTYDTAVFFVELLNDAHKAGFTLGYDDGWSEGFDRGYVCADNACQKEHGPR